MDPKKLKKGKIERQQEIINEAKEAKRELTEKEQEELDNLQREIDVLQQLIEMGDSRGEKEKHQQEGEKGGERTAEEERTRCLEITELGRVFGFETESYIKSGITVEDVRKEIIEKKIRENAPVGTRGEGDISVEKDEEDKYREAAVDALLMRGGIEIQKPAEGANNLRHISLRDLAVDTMARAGETGINLRSPEEIFAMVTRSYLNPTAAFPAILDNAIQKAYVEGHKKVSVTFDKFTKRGSLSDFKTHDNNYIRGAAGEFFEVPEGGELKHDTPTDAKRPTRKLKTYGRQFSMSREAFINDDIGFLTTLPARYAAAARKTQNKQIYEVMINNAAIYDGIPLFDKIHKNVLATGTGITHKAMQTMIMALQTQTDEFGEAIIVRPAVMAVPSGCMFDIYEMFNSPVIHTSDNTQAVNPLYRYRESIEVVEDPTINVLSGGFGNQMPWWLIGDKEDTDFIEIDYLNGNEIPNIRRTEPSGQLGVVWDIYLDWGISVMDFRGAVKNPGTVINDPLK